MQTLESKDVNKVLNIQFPPCVTSLRSRHYEGASAFNALLTPLTFLVSYFNSGLNPLLYAFLSRNFRKAMRELLFCSMKKSWPHSSNKQRLPTQVSGPRAFHASIAAWSFVVSLVDDDADDDIKYFGSLPPVSLVIPRVLCLNLMQTHSLLATDTTLCLGGSTGSHHSPGVHAARFQQ